MKLYCLAANALVTHSDLIVPSLEQLALYGGMTNVYQTCADMEELEQCLTTLIYEDRQFKSYRVLYFVLEGADDYLEIDGSSYSLTEMAELFEGRLTGKMIHFANTKQLEMDTEDSQYFLDVTGAQSISGYTRALPILSSPLDCQFFALLAHYTDVRELTEALYQKHYAQCKTLGFELYY